MDEHLSYWAQMLVKEPAHGQPKVYRGHAESIEQARNGHHYLPMWPKVPDSHLDIFWPKVCRGTLPWG
jgi:hypothetical protein